jgi:hypothetical protein
MTVPDELSDAAECTTEEPGVATGTTRDDEESSQEEKAADAILTLIYDLAMVFWVILSAFVAHLIIAKYRSS